MDWKKLKAEYIAGGTSYRKLAEKYDVPFGTLRKVAAKEKWTELRSRAEAKADTKLVDIISEKESSRANKILDVADKLLDKIAEVIECIDNPTGIKDITTALKNIRDIKGIKSDADLREQEARIAKLQKDAEADKKESNEIKVTFVGDFETYSK